MKTRNKVIISILTVCVAVAAGIWMEVRTCRRMRAAVEQALEMNRNYEAFTSDTIYLSGDSSYAVSLRRVVAYYDHPLRRLWTSANDRLRAGYVLGCVYRDLREAKAAMVKKTGTYEPDQVRHEHYAEVYARYKQLYSAIRPLV